MRWRSAPIAGLLVVATGWAAAPGLFGAACAVVGLLVLARTRETRGEAVRL
ncbi:hypothetical protein [Pseudonocardia sp.]|uniref:hypothetical protein n=1 Tax=Pseudonocardia sp. TaxID=60912 RepID=UPI003D12FD0E